jgi:hypothetical protein
MFRFRLRLQRELLTVGLPGSENHFHSGVDHEERKPVADGIVGRLATAIPTLGPAKKIGKSRSIAGQILIPLPGPRMNP